MTTLRWAHRGAILVAVEVPPTPPPLPMEPPPEPAPAEPAPTPLVKMRACPTCHARVGEVCRSVSGRPARHPHSTRLISRRCECGEPLARYRKAWCDACYVKALRKAQREYNARRRAAKRARSAA